MLDSNRQKPPSAPLAAARKAAAWTPGYPTPSHQAPSHSAASSNRKPGEASSDFRDPSSSLAPAPPPSTGSARTHILVIEDDPHMQKILHRIFREQLYTVTVCGDGQAGLDAFRSGKPSAVILDLVLPNIYGRDLCKIMKAGRPGVPIIVVSAISEVADKVLLLELGADDYVTKPFSPRELMARVQAALRRPQQPAPVATCKFGDCEIDFTRMSARQAGKPIALTAHEFKLLKYFVEHPEHVLGREELLNEVWGYDSYPTTRTVDNQILKLRQKLEPDAAEPRHLQTVYGAGYKFVP
jgi:DNA-binding response OmpR family regulator